MDGDPTGFPPRSAAWDKVSIHLWRGSTGHTSPTSSLPFPEVRHKLLIQKNAVHLTDVQERFGPSSKLPTATTFVLQDSDGTSAQSQRR